MTKLTLTRRQIEWINIYLQLNKNVDHVVVNEMFNNGIGPSTLVQYWTQFGDQCIEENITDVETW